jgi:hypothetical protein
MLAQLDDVGTVNAMERSSRLKDGGEFNLPGLTSELRSSVAQASTTPRTRLLDVIKWNNVLRPEPPPSFFMA